MKRFSLILQYVFFCVFFTVGAGAIFISMRINPEWWTYYQNKEYVEKTRQDNDTLLYLTEQYQSQIELIRSEPNVLGRLEGLTFGKKAPLEGDPTAVLNADSEELMEAANVILDDLRQPPPPTPAPRWLQRCSEPRMRTALFASGGGLILISFIFFGTTRLSKTPEPRRRRFPGDR